MFAIITDVVDENCAWMIKCRISYTLVCMCDLFLEIVIDFFFAVA